ncbi:MAG: hypothetical protein H6719_09655 [Sandaracinaceae bacterium]|nr:hypothetical protein [Sandaracinaceae bacterium]
MSTTALDFGRTSVSTTATSACSATFELKANEKKKVQLAVTGDAFALTNGEWLQLEGKWDRGTTSVEVLTVTYSPSAVGSHTGSLTVSDDKGQVLATVTLQGEAVDQPWIDTDLTTLAFGTTAVGNTEIGSVLVRAPAGDYTFNVGQSGDSQFVVSPTGSKTVSSGGSLTLTVSFTPSAVQSYTGSISIPWTGPNSTSGTLTVSLSGTGVEATADDDATSTDGVQSSSSSTSTQRAIFYIPTYDSVVGLGASYTQDGTTMTQAGFSMSSTRHVFMRAGGSATVQAEGNLWVQSTADDAYLLSGGHSSWAAGKQLYVAGAGYVGMFTGYGGDLVDASNQDDSDLSKPKAVSEIADCVLAADIVWGLSDSMLSILNRAKDLQEFLVLKKWREDGWKGFKKVWNVLKLVGFMLFTVWNTISYVISSIRLLPLQSVSLHAPGGILAGTPSYQSMWGTVGVGTTSLNNTQLGIVALSYEAGYRALIDAVWGQASVVAGKEVNLLALKYWKHAARWDSVNMYGKDIEIGGLVAATKQVPTATITMGAIGKASFKALMPSTGKVSLGIGSAYSMPGSVSVGAKGKTTFTQGNSFKIEGVVYTFECTPTMISISTGAGRLVTLTPGSITFGNEATNIQMLPAAANIGAGTIQITPTSIIANAGVLDLL